jgi:hypothetical protein
VGISLRTFLFAGFGTFGKAGLGVSSRAKLVVKESLWQGRKPQMPDKDHECDVWYAKCPNESQQTEHWLVFDIATDVHLNAQCRSCNAFVRIDKVKKGLVTQSESDAGFTTKEPKPDAAKGNQATEAT